MPRTQEALHLPSIFPARTGAKWAKTAHDKAPLEEGVDPTGENASLIWCRPSVLVGRNRIRRFAEASAGKLLGFLDQVRPGHNHGRHVSGQALENKGKLGAKAASTIPVSFFRFAGALLLGQVNQFRT